jgi:hypothetical protein
LRDQFMDWTDILLPSLVAVLAAIFAVFAGRAQASRLRGLHVDARNGNLRGILTIAAVIAVVFASFFL